MNATNHLITISINLFLVISFCLFYSKVLQRWISSVSSESDNSLVALMFLSGVIPFGILTYSATPVLKTLFEIEMLHGIQLTRLFEFIGLFAATLLGAIGLVLICTLLLWKILFSNGKKLKLHMDDGQLSTAILILGLSSVFAIVLSNPVQWILEGYVQFPDSPLFR